MIDDRGVTSPIEYVITFAISGILVTGLVIGATGLVEDQRSRTVEAQMNVVGQQLAGSLEQVDREITTGSTSVRIVRDLPDELVGQGYTVTVQSDVVVVSSPVANDDLAVPYQTDEPVDSTPVTLNGGDIVIEWDDSTDTLEVQDE